jgi:CheY-like chemotaxis protein
VEDVRVTQKVATVALSRAKYKVELASDGLNAVETYIQSPFDVSPKPYSLGGARGSERARERGREGGREGGRERERGAARILQRCERPLTHTAGRQIILMDIQLPKMDGIEATRRIREWEQQNKKPAAVIFGLTSSVSDEDLERYKSAGMNGCIAKGKILVEAVKEALDEHYAAPERFVIARLSVGGAT